MKPEFLKVCLAPQCFLVISETWTPPQFTTNKNLPEIFVGSMNRKTPFYGVKKPKSAKV